MTPKLKTDAKKRSVLYWCPKCMGDDVALSYHEQRVFPHHEACVDGIGRPFNTMGDEHLHYYCRTCRYDWIGPCLPIKPAARKRGKKR